MMLFGPAGGERNRPLQTTEAGAKVPGEVHGHAGAEHEVTGAQLMNEGLPVTLTGTAQSEIIVIDK